MLKRAIERYPDYAPAHSMLAFASVVSRHVSWTCMEPKLKEAAALAARAAELDDSDPWAHLALGYAAFTDATHRRGAVEEFPARTRSQPQLCRRPWLSRVCARVDGRSDQAIDHLEQALRMSPHDPQNAIFNMASPSPIISPGATPEAVGFGHKAMQQRFGLTMAIAFTSRAWRRPARSTRLALLWRD